ncbi:hypothetical protein BHYA_0025g00050 [Botrytis hyacinthi]|uniref:Uncharacterized protein n=1 Tax=Botrytis hyacinthi TaxID=278943 RepID=A0A4Z1GW47_9HELO|nr:hypothetical protein BHYA_0025g00050 [Botrytis hyacinthi]
MILRKIILAVKFPKKRNSTCISTSSTVFPLYSICFLKDLQKKWITTLNGRGRPRLPGFLERKLSNLEEKSDKLSVAWRNLEDKPKLDKAGVPTTSGNNGTDIVLLTIQLQRDVLQKKQESKGAEVKNFLKELYKF